MSRRRRSSAKDVGPSWVIVESTKSMRLIGMGLVVLTSIALLAIQLAFFPFFLHSEEFYFHALFVFAPLAVGALYFDLPRHAGYSLLVGIATWIHASLMPIDYYEMELANPLLGIPYIMVGSLVLYAAVQGAKRLLAKHDDWGRSRLRTWACFQVSSIAGVAVLNIVLPAFFAVADCLGADIGYLFDGTLLMSLASVYESWLSLLASTLVNSVVYAGSMSLVDAIVRRSVADEDARTLRRVFQRWLLLVVFALFLVCNSASYCIETVRADRDAEQSLTNQVEYLSVQVREHSKREESIKESLEDLVLGKASAVARALENDPDRLYVHDWWVEVCDTLGLSSATACDGEGTVVADSDYEDAEGFNFADSEYTKPYLDLLSGEVDHIVEEPRDSVSLDGLTTSVRVFAGVPRIDDDGFIQVSILGEEYQSALSAASVDSLADSFSVGRNGTVLIAKGDEVISSNDPECRGETLSKLYEYDSAEYDDAIKESMRAMLLSGETIPMREDGSFGVTFLKGAMVGDYGVIVQIPSVEVYANRTVTILLNALIFLLIFASMFWLATVLLNRVVVHGFERTNEGLARITGGDLNQRVEEHETIEFDSLSEGINTTVDALKGWIGEAERRMEGDLATAKAIQESALPSTFPPFPEVEAFDLYASMNAARHVGGDFYDFFLIDDHTLGFLIADVSGKGIPASLFMMAAKTEISNYMSTGLDVSEAILSANHHLCQGNDAGMFVTVWAATLDWETGLLTYCNAGHNFPLLRHGNGGEWEWLTKKCGLFLGTFETAKYRQEQITLEPGDELILYTDGVNEAFSIDEQEYGNDQLEAFLQSHNELHPRQLVEALRDDVAKWAEGAEQSDDITMLCLEYGQAPKVVERITVSARKDDLRLVREPIYAELANRFCPLGSQNAIDIALEELFINVCQYAYADMDEPGPVCVSYKYDADPRGLTIEIADQGIAFNPLGRDDRTNPKSLDDLQLGGLGIMMAVRSVDDISYIRDGDWNRVVFTKRW